MLQLEKKRIESIDVVRGLAMVIMALDHVRDYFHVTANSDDPLNLATTSPALYATRWITHFCAPIFVFLSGTSIYLQSLRKTKSELSVFLIKRGLWLIFAELVIITLAWTFNPAYNFFALQVIWAIGISMVILGLLIRLPFKVILVLGLAIVLGHNLLDYPEASPGFKPSFIWDLLHSARFSFYPITPDHTAIIAYPFLPWTGLMMMGYCFGVFYSPKYNVPDRRKIIYRTGLALIALFIILRVINQYGDPYPWSEQKSGLYTFFSFMKVHKYPPSLMYMCITIGPALLLLAFIENVRNTFTKVMLVYGRTAFFYYILHIYLIHLLSTIVFFAKGYTYEEAKAGLQNFFFMYVIPGEGYGLLVTYGVWILVLLLLYPVCKWYDKYKTNHKEKWWLSYL